jgi:hypothetical protein
MGEATAILSATLRNIHTLSLSYFFIIFSYLLFIFFSYKTGYGRGDGYSERNAA